MHGVAVQVFTQLSGISKIVFAFIDTLADMIPDVIGYYQVVMYKALGFTGGKAILISGIYNFVGPISSKREIFPAIMTY
jgi:hypothetical protein